MSKQVIIRVTQIVCGNPTEMMASISTDKIDRDLAIKIASTYGLEDEVEYCMDNGYTPIQALLEWDCI